MGPDVFLQSEGEMAGVERKSFTGQGIKEMTGSGIWQARAQKRHCWIGKIASSSIHTILEALEGVEVRDPWDLIKVQATSREALGGARRYKQWGTGIESST